MCIPHTHTHKWGQSDNDDDKPNDAKQIKTRKNDTFWTNLIMMVRIIDNLLHT